MLEIEHNQNNNQTDLYSTVISNLLVNDLETKIQTLHIKDLL